MLANTQLKTLYKLGLRLIPLDHGSKVTHEKGWVDKGGAPTYFALLKRTATYHNKSVKQVEALLNVSCDKCTLNFGMHNESSRVIVIDPDDPQAYDVLLEGLKAVDASVKERNDIIAGGMRWQSVKGTKTLYRWPRRMRETLKRSSAVIRRGDDGAQETVLELRCLQQDAIPPSTRADADGFQLSWLAPLPKTIPTAPKKLLELHAALLDVKDKRIKAALEIYAGTPTHLAGKGAAHDQDYPSRLLGAFEQRQFINRKFDLGDLLNAHPHYSQVGERYRYDPSGGSASISPPRDGKEAYHQCWDSSCPLFGRSDPWRFIVDVLHNGDTEQAVSETNALRSDTTINGAEQEPTQTPKTKGQSTKTNKAAGVKTSKSKGTKKGESAGARKRSVSRTQAKDTSGNNLDEQHTVDASGTSAASAQGAGDGAGPRLRSVINGTEFDWGREVEPLKLMFKGMITVGYGMTYALGKMKSGKTYMLCGLAMAATVKKMSYMETERVSRKPVKTLLLGPDATMNQYATVFQQIKALKKCGSSEPGMLHIIAGPEDFDTKLYGPEGDEFCNADGEPFYDTADVVGAIEAFCVRNKIGFLIIDQILNVTQLMRVNDKANTMQSQYDLSSELRAMTARLGIACIGVGQRRKGTKEAVNRDDIMEESTGTNAGNSGYDHGLLFEVVDGSFARDDITGLRKNVILGVSSVGRGDTVIYERVCKVNPETGEQEWLRNQKPSDFGKGGNKDIEFVLSRMTNEYLRTQTPITAAAAFELIKATSKYSLLYLRTALLPKLVKSGHLINNKNLGNRGAGYEPTDSTIAQFDANPGQKRRNQAHAK